MYTDIDVSSVEEYNLKRLRCLPCLCNEPTTQLSSNEPTTVSAAQPIEMVTCLSGPLAS